VDQKELYDRQVNTGDAGDASTEVLGTREAALLNWIQSNTEDLLGESDLRIAELSVGDGQLSRAMAHKYQKATIDCVDISPARLEHCRQIVTATSPTVADRFRFLELNLDTDFGRLERSYYDVVIAIDVLEHVFDPFAFVKHCSQILKPGRTLFLRVPNLAYLKRRIALLRGRLPITSSWFETPGSFQSWKERYGWDGGHLHFFTIDSLAWLLASEGFKCLSWRDVGATAETARRIWPGMLFGNLAVCARSSSGF
jgi:2-polyprenyl-3-methyl-5-hydroxy-6-metoxy-1,4-benzoquinol methylase